MGSDLPSSKTKPSEARPSPGRYFANSSGMSFQTASGMPASRSPPVDPVFEMILGCGVGHRPIAGESHGEQGDGDQHRGGDSGDEASPKFCAPAGIGS